MESQESRRLKLLLQRQLLPPLGLYLAVWFAYAALLRTTLGWGPAIIFGFFCALVVTVLLALVLDLWRARRHHRFLQATRTALPRASSLSAFRGRLEAAHEPVAAPLSGKPCIAWQYAFETAARDGTGRGAANLPYEWFGIGQVALQIVMPYGVIPIRAGALFEGSRQESILDADGAERAARLAEVPSLRVASGVASLGTLLTDLDGLMTDEDGDARIDYVRGPWSPAARLGPPRQMREKRIEPGEEVTVRGRFDAAKRAIVGSPHGVHIAPVRDHPAQHEGASWWRGKVAVLLGVLVINLVVHALVLRTLLQLSEL